MRNILKYIALILVISALTSCTTHLDTMRGDTFTVVGEYTHYPDSLSVYILEYKDNRMSSTDNSKSKLKVILHKDAFEVGDKVKLIKNEE